MPSVRDIEASRGRIEFEREFEEKQRVSEDYLQYEQYCREMNNDGLRPLNFSSWREFMPEELKDNAPEVRGTAASNRATLTQINQVERERIGNQKLTDEELAELTFDLRWRPVYEWEISKAVIIDLFRKFREREPRFDASLHLPPVGYFLDRNRLALTGPHIQIAFNLFWDLGLIEAKPEPAPEPAQPDGFSRYGVNLKVERDPIIEARKQRERYETEIVVTDPETGREWTQYQIDHQADSETYRRLMRIPRVTKNPALEPRH